MSGLPKNETYNWVVMCGTNAADSRVFLNGTRLFCNASKSIHHEDGCDLEPVYGRRKKMPPHGTRYTYDLKANYLKVPSNWAVAEVLTWNRGLHPSEMKQVSDYLLSLLRQGTPLTGL